MRTSQLFYKTSKNANKDAAVLSYELLEKAGYIVKTAKGIYIYTPLFCRVAQKMMHIVREELNAIGGQELVLPILHPAELWQRTGRWTAFCSEGLLYTLVDREDRELCLAPTHEEMISLFVSQWLSGKKQLPLHLYQIATKFRDEIRPRFGLMRAREFLMEDSYTFSDSPEQMEEQYALVRQAYQNIFDRLGLKYVIVEADGGKIGKGKSEEFHILCSLGEDTLCVSGDYGANIETAVACPPEYTYDTLELPKEEVITPNIRTIEQLTDFFSLPPHKILKTLVFKLSHQGTESFVAVGIRGDRQINPTKVRSFFNADECSLASDEEIQQHLGTEKGFIGPLNCPIPFYGDKTTQVMTNFICAGNVPDKHYKNINWSRDLPSPQYADFLLAEAGDGCPANNNAPYEIFSGVEVAHIFNLGTRYTECFDVGFQDNHGKKQICWMGTYGIGIGRTLAACIEQLADDHGIVWPSAIAPFDISILYNGGDLHAEKVAEQLYEQLIQSGYSPLLDDRNERLGFKLKDSDLIGIPYKLILGKTFHNSGVLELESRLKQKFSIEPKNFLNWCEAHFPKQHSYSIY
ncbi:proline--tRNA ligase [Chlamydia gallinacea]|uniref:Proline--tRNA ligase n=2 Tax=Chlamydia gallinacea TaxID=1457153 RepID=A0A173DZG7_9CHLA|nr:proline--tRNA ligase [Chlamydia gallinacea]EYE61850.1 proline--tRNA ligase [Bacteroides fragilis str. S6L5]ANG66305.1 proline--tRNA ligase [Chlamydia gallinacea 08-1274/3]AQT77488.1 proline--tRNA ligase [Chlamydia gallinacea]MBX6679860.1 proline--tRNA ligase [Chlamydia gallinacea]MBX6687092.1 proline--tRNA ligase [Chlamydia gallinacea]